MRRSLAQFKRRLTAWPTIAHDGVRGRADRLAVSILSVATAIKDSIRGKRYRVCLSTDTLERILFSFVEK